MFAAKEIGSYLENNAEDDDVGWSFRDGDVDDSSLTETFFDNSGRSSPMPFLTGTYDEEDEEEEDPLYSMSALDLSDGPHDSTSRLSGTLSISSNTDKHSTTLNQSFTTLSVEAAQKEALRLELSSQTVLGKIQWRYFMELPEDSFARELTRIDWIMYNSFRPRDLVRHVSISGVDKDKIKNLQNVNRMIRQFNHLAFFTASMILLRDKPKHRARCLEKFMNIAVVSQVFCLLRRSVADDEIETPTSKQLQFSRGSDRRHQRYPCPPIGTNPGTSPRSNPKGLHAPCHPHGYPAKPQRLPPCLGELVFRAYPIPPSASPGSCFCRRRKQDIRR